MTLFLDASVLLAASGSETGASRALFRLMASNDWAMLTSHYALTEVHRNLSRLNSEASRVWPKLEPQLVVVDDVLSLDRPVVFPAAKDRPILFTALARADILLTLDRADFMQVIGDEFYGMPVLVPADFLMAERDAGRLTEPGAS